MILDWMPIISAISGSLITLVGVGVTNRSAYKRFEIQLKHEKEMKNEEISRIRKEDTFLLANKFFSFICSEYVGLISVMKGHISYNQYLDLKIDQSLDFDPHKLHMFLKLYFFHLLPVYDEAIQINEKIRSLDDHYKEAYKRGNPDGEKYLSLTLKLVDELEKKLKNLSEK